MYLYIKQFLFKILLRPEYLYFTNLKYIVFQIHSNVVDPMSGSHPIPYIDTPSCTLVHILPNITVQMKSMEFELSKLDAKAGYRSVKLDKECAELTTFSKPAGSYCFHKID